ncbi:hypothetical protein ACUNFK_24220 [Serratia sp. IR-2025]|nr:hypothetical protein SME23J_37010 [Serratia marcescens]
MAAGMVRAIVGAAVWGATGVMAALPSAELRVTGKMAAPRCEVIVPEQGRYDLGKISAHSQTATPIALPPVTQTWRIRCDEATHLAVIPVDNRRGMTGVGAGAYFGLGYGEQSLGYYQLGVGAVRIDLADATAYTAGQPAMKGGLIPLVPGVRTSWQLPDTRLRSGRQFSMDITVFPWLTDGGSALAGGEKLEGAATLDFIFGL